MKEVRSFHKISKDDVKEAGGKGASLGEMTRLFGGQAQNPVPSGFVVLASAFEKFLHENEIHEDIDAILKKVNHQDPNSVDGASREIQTIILQEEVTEELKKEILTEFNKLNSKFVAVRSSATAEDSKIASWAGELDSFLFVSKKDLLEKVQKCWASLFTPRAIFYRFEKNLHQQKISVAVVVQKMVNSEVSGVCFTVHPVTKDKNQMVIEAGYGLGEAIVQGIITPDTYVIDKSKLEILDKNISEQSKMIVPEDTGGTTERQVSASISEKQKLSDAKILEVAKLALKIEKHYGSPQDIEFSLEKGKIYILQSRPITTL